MISNCRSFARRSSGFAGARTGQSLVEYALVISFVSLLSVVFMSIFEAQLRGIYTSITVVIDAVRALI
jgi:Flp pilus assembly pilin Flp